ncbi:unnamed protein product [Clonostachys rosea f. rosea IK726]|uniref:Uncharacterized protein n=1 Tax=Clonostachys rosea f. rosea IK726 TaxID=1349383 RepID=A0ACA9TIF9_BIOOC|nr:unnamed protein product [Clonostachys rosea f. rosea IK726]
MSLMASLVAKTSTAWTETIETTAAEDRERAPQTTKGTRTVATMNRRGALLETCTGDGTTRPPQIVAITATLPQVINTHPAIAIQIGTAADTTLLR